MRWRKRTYEWKTLRLNPNKYSSEGTWAKKHSTNYQIPKQMRTSTNNMAWVWNSKGNDVTSQKSTCTSKSAHYRSGKKCWCRVWNKDLEFKKERPPKYTQNALNKLRSPKRALSENKLWTCMLTLEMPAWELEETLWDYPEKEQIDSGKEGCKKNWWNCAGAKIWSTRLRSTKMELKTS